MAIRVEKEISARTGWRRIKMEPTMLYYDPSGSGVNLTIGKDAGYYHRDQPNVVWNQDRQPYGYAGVRRLFETLTEKVLQKGEKV